jgi:hypothetical protein
MFTDEIEGNDLVKNSFSVARVNHDFASSRSSLGGVFVNRSGIGVPDNYNRVFAMDGKLGLGKKAQLTGFISKSTTPGITTNDHAFKFLVVFNWNGWNLWAGYS